MAATVTVDEFDARPRYAMACMRIVWACDAAAATFSVALPKPIFGSITHIVSKAGATVPTDLCDVALLGQDGADRLQGAGADAISASVVKTTPTMTEASVGTNKYGVNPSIAGFVTLEITNNSVNGATGTLWVYYR